jgi:glucan biosynthesis protein
LYIPNLETENPKFAKALVDLADEVTMANKVIYEILDTVDITNIYRFIVAEFTKVLVAVLLGGLPGVEIE